MGELLCEGLVEPEQIEDEALEEGAKLQAYELFNRLQSTFSPPAYITLQEVRDATGFDGVRTADALAISLYRSRGKAVWGFELKVSRSDWLHELKQPEKAESIMRYCNYWALVVPNKDIVKPGELPETWGMYVAQKNRLKCVIPCPKLDPLPMSLTMLTAIVYAVANRQTKADEAALKKARDEGYNSGISRLGDNTYEQYYKELSEKIDAYEKASGLTIKYGWTNPEKVGKIVRLLLDGDAGIKQVLDTAKYNLSHNERIKVQLEKQVEILESAMIAQKNGKLAPESDEEED